MKGSPDIFSITLQKGARAQVRVVLSIWRGQTKVHVREYDPGAIAGQWWPGKGACLDIDKLPELLLALTKAEAEARRLGLLGRKEVQNNAE